MYPDTWANLGAMRRRDLIKGIIAATTVALPEAARAQQLQQMRRIGVLMK
jgi:hypothetical protein